MTTLVIITWDQVTLLLVDKIVWSQALSCSHHHHHDWCEHSSISCWVTGIIVLSPAQLSQLSNCAVQSSSLPLCSSTQHMIFGHFIWKPETFEHYCCDHTVLPSLSPCLVSTTLWNSLLSLNFKELLVLSSQVSIMTCLTSMLLIMMMMIGTGFAWHQQWSQQ